MRPKDDAKVKAIYKACLDMIVEGGLVGITLQKVAKRANIATSTIYVYFKSKEELLESLFITTKATSTKIYFADINQENSYKTNLKRLWINILKHRMEYYPESIFTEAYYYSPYLSDEVKKETDLQLTPLFDLIEEGRKQDLIKSIDTMILLSYMVGSIFELVDKWKRGMIQLDQKTIEEAWRLTWDGMKS